MSDERAPHEDERVASRSELLAEEQAAGSEDPTGQAQAILDESEVRTLHPEQADDVAHEHRHSEDVVDPP